MDIEQFEGIKQYVEFDDASRIQLAKFKPLATPEFNAIVADFYDAITRHPSASVVITGGSVQVERLKNTLVDWLGSLLTGPHDETYLRAHSRIGRVHVRIGLPQEFMLTAMNRIRLGLLAVANERIGSAAELASTTTSLHKILDIELAIMLDTYRLDWMERVRVNERLATVGQMAASIGHELRNPLSIVQSSLFLIEQRRDKVGIDDAIVAKHTKRIAEQVHACEKTIASLLELTRDNPPRKTRLTLSAVTEDAAKSITVPEGVTLHLAVPEDLEAEADFSQLRQLLLNLIVNGLQAVGNGGRVEVTGNNTTTGPELWVSDNGSGVSEDARGRIFDVLFTTRASGTGLGLALCKKIALAHGGELDLVPSNAGARFRVWLPLGSEQNSNQEPTV